MNVLHPAKPTEIKAFKVFSPSQQEELCFCLLFRAQKEELQAEPTHAPGTADGGQEAEEAETCKGRKTFSTEERKSVGGAIERLGLELLENLPTGRQQPNVILSPLSVALALAQLMLGQ